MHGAMGSLRFPRSEIVFLLKRIMMFRVPRIVSRTNNIQLGLLSHKLA